MGGAPAGAARSICDSGQGSRRCLWRIIFVGIDTALTYCTANVNTPDPGIAKECRGCHNHDIRHGGLLAGYGCGLGAMPASTVSASRAARPGSVAIWLPGGLSNTRGRTWPWIAPMFSDAAAP